MRIETAKSNIVRELLYFECELEFVNFKEAPSDFNGLVDGRLGPEKVFSAF